ncbi:restriction endonuclease subunit S [Huintestinicola sp.]
MVKQGYKQTEIGVIPEDWEIDVAKNLMKIETGSRNTEDKNDNGRYSFFVRSQQIERIDSYHYDCEAVLTAGDGVGTGKVFHYITGKFDAHQRVYVMTNFNKIRGKFFYLFFSENFGNEVAKYTAKSSVDSVRRDMIAEMKIPLPPIPEQERISEALSNVDNMISSLEKLIEKKKAIKQGAMQELLTGKKRLAGFSGEWEKINLSKKSKIKARIGWQGLTTNEYLNSGFAYLITGTDFVNGKINWNDCCYVSRDRFEQDKNIQIQNNDILITKDGSLGKTAIVKGLNKPATLNSGVFVIKPIQESYNPTFVYYILSSFVFKEFLEHLSAGSTIIHLYQKDINKFEFIVPPTIEEQTAIASILSDMDDEIEALEQKLAKTRQIKQGMMQELLTGRIRLV